MSKQNLRILYIQWFFFLIRKLMLWSFYQYTNRDNMLPTRNMRVTRTFSKKNKKKNEKFPQICPQVYTYLRTFHVYENTLEGFY